MSSVVYIESSIISYLTSRPSRDLVAASRQAITAEWWLNSKSQFEVYISALVIEEISGGDAIAAAQRMQAVADIPSVAITEDAQVLANVLLTSKRPCPPTALATPCTSQSQRRRVLNIY